MSHPTSPKDPSPLILVVEDSRTQAEKLRFLLESQDFQVKVAENGKVALQLLEEIRPALIISDIVMPEMDGYQFCLHVKTHDHTKQIPVILLTSLSKTEDVLEGLECGVDYFITKPYSESYLLTSIEQILKNQQLRRPDQLRVGTEIVVGDKKRLITTDQQQTLSLLLSTYEAAVRTNDELAQAQSELKLLNSQLENLVLERTAALSEEIKVRRHSEERVSHLNVLLRAIRSINTLITHEKDPALLMQGVCRILVKDRGYENAQVLLTDKSGGMQLYRQDGFDEALNQLLLTVDPTWLPYCCQQAGEHGKIYHLRDRRQHCHDCPLNAAESIGDVFSASLQHGGKSYGYITVSMTPLAANDEDNRQLFAEMAADLSSALYNIEQGLAIQEAEKDRQRIEMELRQAQKMEAVGRLAGGVAHDFNNMLGVILGYSEIILNQVDQADPVHGFVEEIKKAGERSAELARQLLAFSSRQIVSPRVIDLNRTITEMQKMLGRLIGEDLEFRFIPGEGLWRTLIDPSQVNQVLANLAVNARDAIDGPGIITIETSNVTLDEDYCRKYAQVDPGDYLLLAFSDTGMGMNADLLSHIFEPFFTTKEEGKGTGLGLSTVFGIVKQYDGFIHTYSEPGLGTTFKIYLPRFLGQVEEDGPKVKEAASKGSETVLLVEDEKQLLALARAVLTSYGHEVLTANTPDEALKLVRSHPGEIHLLLTDVVLPEINGKQLQGMIKELKPSIKTLFMSGYTANAIVHRGLLEKGVFFISKPFTINSLMRKVRETLDS